jgi:hypothetical protein
MTVHAGPPPTDSPESAPAPNAGRRHFLRAGATSSFVLGAGSLLLAACSREQPARKSGAEATPGALPLIDYGRCFVQGKAKWNRVRFEIESRARILDDQTGTYEDFYQCASCKAEQTFAARDLFSSPNNFDFLVVFGDVNNIQFRRTAHFNPEYRQVIKTNKMWEGHLVNRREPRTSRVLPTTEAIRQATHEGLRLVAQTEIANPALGLRAIVDFPIKTMNIHDGKDLYQVDTGPVAYPDLSQRYTRLVDSISLAFVAFYQPSIADFIIEDETPIEYFGREVTRVHHYARTVSVPVRNQIFAIET